MGLDCTPIERTRLFATACRINSLYMIAEAGSGHPGSSFSAMEIVSWLHLNEMRPAASADSDGDLYFSSKGHDVPGLYSVLLGLGELEFDLIHSLRRIGGLPGHPDVATPGVHTNTGSLGMGISKAKGLVLARRLRGAKGNVFVLTGDGELQEGQIWESLPSAAHRHMGEITVIVDHNKIQSDTWVADVNDLGDLEAKFSAFGWEAMRCDGHDLEMLASCLERCRSVGDRPKVIIADTVKGYGVSFMAHTAMAESGDELYRFHSGAPDEESYRKAVEELADSAHSQLELLGAAPLELATRDRSERAAPNNPQRLVGAYSRALVEQAEQHETLTVLDADLMLDCGLIPFRDRFPERFIECGIAEQDMVSTAGGLALSGLLPVVHSFSCFLSARPNEQMYNNATEGTKIIYVGSLAGVVPGGPGHSHQSVRDISALGGIPDLTMLEPCMEKEVGMALDYAVNTSRSSVFLRLVSIPCDIPFALPEGYRMEYGRGVTVTEGEDAVIFAYGPVMLAQAVSASEHLRRESGIGLSVVNLPWLNCVDHGWLARSVEGFKHIFTLDNHYLKGGQGEMLACSLAEHAPLDERRIHRFGLGRVPLCGRNDETLAAHSLDGRSLASGIRDRISRQ